MTTKTDTRERILEAAMARISHYGYGKTTMAEIARDCDMSAGNIYRFFASKLDIAEAMARNFNSELFQEYARISRADQPARDRLNALFNYAMNQTFQKLDNDAKILEVAEVLSAERPEFHNEELAQERIHVAKIIADGVKTGEFAPVEDPALAAEMIQSAVMKFKYPQLWSALTLPRLKRELDGVMAFIIAALEAGVELKPDKN